MFRLSQLSAAKSCIQACNLTKHHCSPQPLGSTEKTPAPFQFGKLLFTCKNWPKPLLTGAVKHTPPSCLCPDNGPSFQFHKFPFKKYVANSNGHLDWDHWLYF